MTAHAMRTLLQRKEQLIDGNKNAEEEFKINKRGDAMPSTESTKQ